MWGILMILTRFPEEGIPYIFSKLIVLRISALPEKTQSQQKTKNRNIDASPMMWDLLMILTRFPEFTSDFPQNEAFSRSRSILKKAASAKNEKQKY